MTLSDVTVGDDLPALEVVLSARHVVMGASASRDWQPQHHDTRWAVEHVRVADIFLNTPTQAGWIERYVTEWTGPGGRLGRLRFRMRRSVCAGDAVRFEGRVLGTATDEAGVGWVDLEICLVVEGEVATECRALVAVPTSVDDDPWRRCGDEWRPEWTSS